MKAQILNVSLINRFNNLSYPIFVGNNLLSNCEEILKKFVVSRKIVLIHDDFFSFEKVVEERRYLLLLSRFSCNLQLWAHFRSLLLHIF